MNIRVDWYKPSGKWYSGGIVDIGDAKLYKNQEVEQAIVDKQQLLLHNWHINCYYTVVVSNINDEDAVDSFCYALFIPEHFKDITRSDQDG